MSSHYSDVICPFRGGVANFGSDYPIEWLDQKCVGPACAKWAGGITHHGSATTSPAGFCAIGQPSQPLIAGPPPERR